MTVFKKLYSSKTIDFTAIYSDLKIGCKNLFVKLFGQMKKLNSSLQRKKYIHQQQNMLSTKLHIEAVNWFSSKGLNTISGACVADS